MQLVLIVILLFVTLALIGVILIQKSEGGASGLTGGSAMGGMMSARGATNLLTRTTAVLAALFMGICLLLAILAGRKTEAPSILEKAPSEIASSKEEAPQ
jgi:preprotein translocase subunit SecG